MTEPNDINTIETAQPQRIEDDPIEVRKAKRLALIAAGEEPYGRNFQVTARAAELEERYKDLPAGESTEDFVQVAGRIMAFRNQGKAIFIVLRDASGYLQLFVRINVVGEDAFARIKDLDVGDWVGAYGTVLRTRRGQLSVLPDRMQLLSKSLRPLPEKFHGLKVVQTSCLEV